MNVAIRSKRAGHICVIRISTRDALSIKRCLIMPSDFGMPCRIAHSYHDYLASKAHQPVALSDSIRYPGKMDSEVSALGGSLASFTAKPCSWLECHILLLLLLLLHKTVRTTAPAPPLRNPKKPVRRRSRSRTSEQSGRTAGMSELAGRQKLRGGNRALRASFNF
jgi:hypothetical protein